MLSSLSPEIFRDRARFAEVALQNRMPTIFASREFAEAGGFMAYGVSFPEQFRRVAEYVDKVLRGAKPSDLPIEQPTRFELVLNLRAATAMGHAFPPGILLRADEVIE